MRTIKQIIIVSLLLVLITGCDPLYSVFFVNQSERSVYAFFNYDVIYPDTSLTRDFPLDPNYPTNTFDTSTLCQFIGTSIDLFYFGETRVDTISICIVDSDSVRYYSWDTIVKYNNILQRYDLSLYDLEELDGSRLHSFAWLYFPPTEAMKHIHMWPPYGTYDEHGRRKDTK